MQKLLIATHNKGKLPEITKLLEGINIQIVTLNDENIALDVEETGSTFEENAILKAKTYGEISGLLTLADDGGLEVDALDGRPGVFSKRYADTDHKRISKLLTELKNIPLENRTCRFTLILALYNPKSKEILTTKGIYEGLITLEPRGYNGFGYDSVFYNKELEKTNAEMTMEEKNSVSHRGKALKEMKEIILNNL